MIQNSLEQFKKKFFIATFFVLQKNTLTFKAINILLNELRFNFKPVLLRFSLLLYK